MGPLGGAWIGLMLLCGCLDGLQGAPLKILLKTCGLHNCCGSEYLDYWSAGSTMDARAADLWMTESSDVSSLPVRRKEESELLSKVLGENGIFQLG